VTIPASFNETKVYCAKQKPELVRFSASEERQRITFRKATAIPAAEAWIGTERDKHGVKITGMKF
jgi:hypothetical protein